MMYDPDAIELAAKMAAEGFSDLCPVALAAQQRRWKALMRADGPQGRWASWGPPDSGGRVPPKNPSA